MNLNFKQLKDMNEEELTLVKNTISLIKGYFPEPDQETLNFIQTALNRKIIGINDPVEWEKTLELFDKFFN